MKATFGSCRISPAGWVMALCLGAALTLAACSRGFSAQFPAGAPGAAGAARPAAQAEAAMPAPTAVLGGAATAGLPDFSQLVDRYGPAVVNVEVVEKTPVGRHPGNLAQRSVLRLLPPLRHSGSRFRAARASAAAARRRVGVHRQSRRLHPYQHPCGRERRRGDRAPHRPARVSRQGDRRRRAHRRRGHQDQRQQSADRQARRPDTPQARAVGARHRLAVRLREHRHRGHHQRHRSRGTGRELRALHPDRRGGESRQFRRAAVQHGR